MKRKGGRERKRVRKERRKSLGGERGKEEMKGKNKKRKNEDMAIGKQVP